MKRILAIFIAIMLFVPSFVYAEGGKTMPKFKTGSGAIMPDAYVPPGTPNSGQYDGGSTGSGYVDRTTDLDSLYEAQLKAQLAAIAKQRDSALSSLSTQQTALTNDFYGKRNQVAANSDIGAMNFAQFMASRGIAGNAGAMPEIYRNNALQGNLGALGQQEAEGNAAIEANRAQINDAYASDVAAAKNAIEAAKLQAIIEQQRTDQANALEQQRYDTQMKTMADNTAYNRQQDTKNDYMNTIGRFSNDYQAEINKVMNDGDPSNDWQIALLSAARQNKIEGQKSAESAQAAAEAKAMQQQFENDLKLKQLDLDTKRTNYTINRPYGGKSSGLTANQQLNQTNDSKISQMINWIYSGKTTNDQIQNLVENKAAIIQQLIEAGYDGSAALNFYNNIYADLME